MSYKDETPAQLRTGLSVFRRQLWWRRGNEWCRYNLWGGA